MFAEVQSSSYLTSLYSIINQIRYQRQPYCELRVLVEGVDPEAENILSTMLISDNKNPSYTMDFNKFLATITGGGLLGPGVSGGSNLAAGGSGSTAGVSNAGYY